MSVSKFVNKPVALVVVLIVTAAIFPIAMNTFAEDESSSLTIAEGETEVVKAQLEATVDEAVAGSPGNATITLSDGDNQASVSLDEGQNQTVTVGGDDVTVSLSSTTDTQATADYSYPTSAGWDDSTSQMFVLLPVFFVIGLLLYYVGILK